MDQVEEVKSKIDIVEVISSYVPLKKAGRNMSGLCPFHGEKTPSFMVSPERQVFKCFGCGEGGDVFTFLQKKEGWDFKETLEELAGRAGVKLATFKPTEASRQKEKILAVNKYVAKFYSYVLWKHKIGEEARQYLAQRQTDETVAKKFGLGFAPSGWDRTLTFLNKRGFSSSDIASGGLVVARDKSGSFDRQGFYDRFRGRLVFPLRDARGVVLGFSGRIISESDSKQEPKYLNSPETPVFNKGSILFGLDLAKEAIREKNEAILMEGEFDVISSYQAGVTNAVASKGTALTERQVALLARLCERVTLCFDTDVAGDKASRRGIEMLDAAGLTVKVVKMGDFKDPDEFIKKDLAGFKKAVNAAENIYDYYIESVSARFNPKSAEGKKKIGQEIIPILANIGDDMVRAHYISKLASVLDLDINLVSAAVPRKGEKANEGISAGSLPSIVYDNNTNELERYFFALLVSGDTLIADFFKILSDTDFEAKESREFWQALRAIMSNSKTRKTAKIIEGLPSRFKSYVDEIFLVNIGNDFIDAETQVAELVKITKRIRENSIKKQFREISRELKGAEGAGDVGKIEKLSKKFNEVSISLKKDLNES